MFIFFFVSIHSQSSDRDTKRSRKIVWRVEETIFDSAFRYAVASAAFNTENSECVLHAAQFVY